MLRRAISLPLVALALAGCADEIPPPPKEIPITVTARYTDAPDTVLAPYPSDRFTAPDEGTPTGLRVALGPDVTHDPLALAYPSTIAQLNAMDGFSTAGGVAVVLSGAVDVRGIVIDERADPPILDPPRDASAYKEPGSPFYLVNVDPSSPEKGKLHGIVPRFWAQPADVDFAEADYTLVLMPAEPLQPATRYLAVVTDALPAADGGRVGPSPDMEAILNGTASSAYASEVRAGLDVLEEAGGPARDHLALATVFTTASVTRGSFAMAKRARERPAPAITSGWTIETPLQTDGRARFKARFTSPEYRRPLPTGTWEEGPDGAPAVQEVADLEVFLAFSDATVSGPRPVVIFQHGLGGDKDGCWGTAERLASLGVAVIAIDSPEHGSRAPEGSTSIAQISRFFGVDFATGAFDITRARDNFRQMTADQLELVRLVGALGSLDLLPVGAPDGVPDLDPSQLMYIGHSFGSVQGPAVFALAPEIKRTVWNVGGDSLMMLIRDSGLFSLMVNGLKPSGTTDGALGRFFAATQALVDPGDPINYARYGALERPPFVPNWAPRDMLIQMVIDDGIVPNSTSEALARAAGLTLIDPIRPISGLASAASPLENNLPGGATGAISQFDTMDGMTAEHGGLIFSSEGQAQYVLFFASGLASPNAHATVQPAYPAD